jgi:hypothetical protein
MSTPFQISTHDQGDKVSSQSTQAETPRTTTGIFALLAGLLRGRGTGAPKTTQTAYAVARRDTLWFFAPLSLAAFCVLLLMTFTTSASANSAHESLPTSFGTGAGGANAGELDLLATTITNGALEAPGSGVAVNDETHNVYVADTGNRRVDVFNAKGEFQLAFGADVGGAGVDTCTLICSAGTSGSSPGEFETPTFVAIDNSGGESEGDVYVADSATSLIQKFSATGVLQASWGDGTPSPNGQLSGSPTGEEGALVPFEPPAGITVDASGNLWAFDLRSDQMFEFEQNGTFLQDWSTRDAHPSGIAVDGADDLYFDGSEGRIEKYSATGEFIGKLTGEAVEGGNSGAPAPGLAVDPASGEVYVDLGDSIEHFTSSCKLAKEFEATCEPVETFGALQLTGGAGLAVDPGTNAAYADTVYAANTTANRIDGFAPSLAAVTSASSNVLATTATVAGTVNPEASAVSECKFEYGSSTEYGHSVPCEETVGAGTTPVEVHANLTGLEGGTTYHYRVAATNAKATVAGEDGTFTTLPLPVLTSAEAVNVTASSATLQATLNPAGLQVTACEFQYGTSTAYDHAVPCEQSPAQIGAGATPVFVSANIPGPGMPPLAANTPYHWRLVARDADGASATPDHTFVYETGGGGLPDHRAYEMVTPPRKNGAYVGDLFTNPVDIASDGSRLIDQSIQCFGGAQSCTGLRDEELGEPYAFTRTPAGWVTIPFAPPATQFSTNTSLPTYSADTAAALFSMPVGAQEDWYLREPSGAFVPIGPIASTGLNPETHKVRSTADLSHLIWQSEGFTWPLLGKSLEETIYEYSGTGHERPLLVGVTGGLESESLVSTCETTVGGHDSVYDAMSADGRTVYFTAKNLTETCLNHGAEGPSVGELYARVDGETPEAHTIAISQPDAPQVAGETARGHESPPDDECISTECQKDIADQADWREAEFEGASEDGSKVFFLDPQRLTDQATEGTGSASGGDCALNRGKCNLYLYDFDRPAGHNLIDVSAGAPGALGVGGPQVQGVVATSADGSHVYFVANGVLAPGAPQGTCRPEGGGEVAGTCDLYVYQRDARYPDGHVAFIASLPAADSDDTSWSQDGRRADVTPDGRFLVFESRGDLTPGDTRSGGPEQVFRYDAETEELVRVSIGQDGFNDNGTDGLLGGESLEYGYSGYTGDAHIVPAASTVFSAGPLRGDPTMSDDGAYVFFQSPAALTPQALNDVPSGHGLAQNVYEWEADGTGACTQGEGCVYLTSDGKDTANGGARGGSVVRLFGADVTGSNVFFTTADQLVPADTDTQVDIYDARVCTASEPCPEPPPLASPCNEEACHGIPAAAPSLLTPGSATFNGQGNIPPITPKKVTKKAVKCKKNFVKNKKDKCVKRPKKKAKPAKKATNDRRATR